MYHMEIHITTQLDKVSVSKLKEDVCKSFEKKLISLLRKMTFSFSQNI